MDKIISDHISKFYTDVNSDIENRMHIFLSELIKSGDVFLYDSPRKPVLTENDMTGDYKLDLNHYNLCAYEPYREKKRLESKIQTLEKKNKILMDALEKYKNPNIWLDAIGGVHSISIANEAIKQIKELDDK